MSKDDKDLELRSEELEAMNEPLDDVEFEELDWVGDEKKDKEKLKKLREDLKKSQAESRDHLTALQRARADYVNLKKELDEVRESVKSKTMEKMIMEFLPVVDSFDMAMANKEVWESVDKNWRIGIEYINTQFHTILSNYGVEPIDKSDIEFDPNLHEPMKTEETDDTSLDHKVKQIIQKGYKMGDKVIRPARVIVWKAK
jgi:molecular chaperone GrpE